MLADLNGDGVVDPTDDDHRSGHPGPPFFGRVGHPRGPEHHGAFPWGPGRQSRFGRWCFAPRWQVHLRQTARRRRGSVAKLLAGAGALVASLGYPLAPDHPFPEAIDIGYAALEWLAALRGTHAMPAHHRGGGGRGSRRQPRGRGGHDGPRPRPRPRGGAGAGVATARPLHGFSLVARGLHWRGRLQHRLRLAAVPGPTDRHQPPLRRRGRGGAPGRHGPGAAGVVHGAARSATTPAAMPRASWVQVWKPKKVEVATDHAARARGRGRPQLQARVRQFLAALAPASVIPR